MITEGDTVDLKPPHIRHSGMIRPTFKHTHLNTSHTVSQRRDRQTDRRLREGMVGSLKWHEEMSSSNALTPIYFIRESPKPLDLHRSQGWRTESGSHHCTPETTAFSRRLGRSRSRESSHKTEAVLSTEGTKFHRLWVPT